MREETHKLQIEGEPFALASFVLPLWATQPNDCSLGYFSSYVCAATLFAFVVILILVMREVKKTGAPCQ